MKHLSTSYSTLLFIVGLLCFSMSSLSAHNGAIAYAYPLTSLTIDGHLNDWPEHSEKHPIALYQHGAQADHANDMQAYFMVAYSPDEQAIYLAAVCTEDDYVKTPDNNHYSSHDFHVLYLDPIHFQDNEGGTGVIAYEVDEYHQKIVEQERFSFYPTVAAANWDNVDLVINRQGKTVVYEWKITLPEPLSVHQTIGFDYAVFDKDTDQSHAILTWGQSSNKFMAAGRLGDLFLLGEDETLYQVEGQLTKRDSLIQWPSVVHIKSGELHLSAAVEEDGRYAITLPTGTYWAQVFSELQGERWYEKYRLSQTPGRKLPVDRDGLSFFPIDLAYEPAPDFITNQGILQAPFDDEAAGKIDAFISEYQRYYRIPGVSLAIVQNGKVVYHQTYGTGNAITGEPLKEDAVFEAASITKSVFAYTMNRLAQRGDFDLNQPIYELLTFPELEETPDYKLMTGRHVLTHVSGLPNWGDTLLHRPGTEYGYSGEGFEYLKKALATTQGSDMPTIIQNILDTEVLNPLGMNNTYFMCQPQLEARKVTGHYDAIPTGFECPTAPGMAFSMHTEAKDFATFALALLNREGLDAEQAKDMFTLHTLDDDLMNPPYKNGFGLGIALRESPYGLVFGHGGNNGDFRCGFEMYDELKTGYIIFTNADSAGPLLFDFPQFLVEGKYQGER